MSTLQHQQHALELLDSNMESICHELEGLLTNEPECVEADLAGASKSDYYNFQGASSAQQFYWQCVQERQQQMQQQHQLEQQLLKQQQLELHIQQQKMLMEMQQEHLQQFNKLPSNMNTPDNQVPANIENCYVGAPPTFTSAPYEVAAQNQNAAASGYTASNNYEFHYLRPQAFNKSEPNANPIPLISAAANSANSNADHSFGETRRNFVGGGAYRKQNYRKHNYKKVENVVEEIDYDKIEINMEELGFTGDDMSEKNPVLRVMGKFRLLNYYLHDVFPCGPTFMGFPTQPKPIPYTMNIQYQVKNATRNCTIFMCSKERILNANKLLDREFYAECEKSLNVMRKMCAQLDTFKRINMEHKRCQFVNEDVKVQAQRLELILEELSDQVRECNFLVHLLEWSIETKYKTQTENLPSANCTTSSSLLAENNGNNNEDNGADDGYNLNVVPEIAGSGMRQPIRFIG